MTLDNDVHTSDTAPAEDTRTSATPRRNRRRIAVAAIALVLVAAAGAWFFARGEAAAPDVATAEAVRGDIQDTVTALGNLQPRDYVDVGAQVSGQIKEIHAAVGDVVKAGDLLVEIDPRVLVAKVEADRASVAGLKAQIIDKEAQAKLTAAQLSRQQRLRTTGAASQEALDTAEANAQSASAQIDVLKAQLEQAQSTLSGDETTLGYTKIYAPMSGTVVSLDARKGQTLNTNQSTPILMRIADLSTMTVWTQVSEADVARLKIGMPAFFTTLGSDTRRWTGTLRQIMPTPEVVNNVVLYTALFDVANPTGDLMTQMTAQVSFVVAEAKNVLTVPAAAVTTRGRGERARSTVKTVGTLGGIETREVKAGITNRVDTEIVSGLEVGEKVVIGTRAADAAQPQHRRSRLPRL
jgi:macrolide-specific efflux system membrane fusion protein